MGEKMRKKGLEQQVNCHASLAMTGEEGAGLPRFACNDGRRGTGLPRFARNDGSREWLDCFTLFAMTGEEGAGLPCFARNDGERGLDCHASLAMTGGEGSGESKTLKKFEKNCFISLLEYT